MKIYLVEERGGKYDESYRNNLAVCATKERAIAFLNDKKSWIEAVNPCDRVTWVFEDRESHNSSKTIYVLTYISKVCDEVIDFFVYEMDLLE